MRAVFSDQIFYDNEKSFLSCNDALSSTLTNNDISLQFGKTVNFFFGQLLLTVALIK